MSEREITTAALRALLGPDGPELSCEECFEMLDTYVEADLAREDPELAVPGMRAHLLGCPACGEDFEALRDLVAGKRRRSPEPG
jgi:hypothetical protein